MVALQHHSAKHDAASLQGSFNLDPDSDSPNYVFTFALEKATKNVSLASGIYNLSYTITADSSSYPLIAAQAGLDARGFISTKSSVAMTEVLTTGEKLSTGSDMEALSAPVLEEVVTDTLVVSNAAVTLTSLSNTFEQDPIAEPTTAAVLGVGMLGVGWFRRQRRGVRQTSGAR